MTRLAVFHGMATIIASSLIQLVYVEWVFGVYRNIY